MKEKISFPLTLGPIHPAFKEPISFSFQVDGEKVVSADIDFGYTHRGIEWVSQKRNFIQIIYLLERVCGICSASHPIAYSLAIEQAADIEVPPRAKYIRVIIGELERLHSHLLWAGVAAHELGFDTAFYFTWNIREKVLDLLELITGNRINYGMLTIGGVRRDITEEQYPIVREIMGYYTELYERAGDIFLGDLSIKARTEGIGILTYEDAEKFCAVGPTGRASGLKKDIRVDFPSNAYADMGHWLRPITPETYGKKTIGDTYDRIVVRVLELKQSVDIINFCLENMPDGDYAFEHNAVKIINKLKKIEGEGIGRYEAPRGEVAHYDILDKREGPVHLKVKAPTYSNAMSWPSMLKDVEIADLPIVIASIDPCIACSDRMSFTKVNSGKYELTASDLHKLSVQKMREVQKQC